MPIALRSWYDMGAEMDHGLEELGTIMLRRMPIAITTARLK